MLGNLDLQIDDSTDAANQYDLSWMIIQKMCTSLIQRHFTEETRYPTEANYIQFMEYFGERREPGSMALEVIAILMTSRIANSNLT